MRYIHVFLLSMLPILELRGAMIYSQAYGLNIFLSAVISIIGNMIVMPFIFIFAKRILVFLSDKRYVGLMCKYILKKGHDAGQKLLKNAKKTVYIALVLFVGIPLPGTGVWTGVLAASLLDLDIKKSAVACFFGTVLSCTIMGTISYVGFKIF